MFAALVVRRRSKLSRRCSLQFDSLEVTIEREIEVEAGLLAVRDDVQAGPNLIVQGCNHGVILNLADVRSAEGFEMLTRKFEPARERITADHGGAQGAGLHESGS